MGYTIVVTRAATGGHTHIPEDLVYTVISETIGAPVGPLSETEGQRFLRLKEVLTSRIFGQEEAIELAANAVIAHRVSKRRRRPTVLLLVGPTRSRKPAARSSSSS